MELELETDGLVSLVWTTSGSDYQMGSAEGYKIVYSDNFPPGKISDLELELETDGLVSLVWTTSGGDYQMGSAEGYKKN